MSDEQMPPRGRLREHAAEEIRVILARRRMSAAELARRTGIKQSTMSRRMTGETAFDLDDLEAIAEVLGIAVGDLLPQSAGVNLSLTPVVRPVRATSTGTPLRRTASRPMVPTRRDLARPVSAIPSEHRRPQPTRSPERRRAA